MKFIFTLIVLIFSGTTVFAQTIAEAILNRGQSLDIINLSVNPHQTVGFKPSPVNIFDKRKDVSTLNNITLRCGRTNFSTEPLLVIDGVPFQFDELKKLDPNDIASIDILKESATTTLYGCRPATGVIIITTKAASARKFIIKDFLNGQTIPLATIWFTSGSDSIRTMANDSGILVTDKLKAGIKYDVTVSSAGYKTYSTSVSGKQQEILLEKDIKLCKEVVVKAFFDLKFMTVHDSAPQTVTHCDWETFKYNTVSDSRISTKPDHLLFTSIYPNPVQRNNVLNIELKNEQDETIQLVVISMNGSIVSLQSKKITKGLNRLSITADSKWTAGIYNIQLRNEKGTLIRQEKLVVQ